MFKILCTASQVIFVCINIVVCFKNMFLGFFCNLIDFASIRFHGLARS